MFANTGFALSAWCSSVTSFCPIAKAGALTEPGQNVLRDQQPVHRLGLRLAAHRHMFFQVALGQLAEWPPHGLSYKRSGQEACHPALGLNPGANEGRLLPVLGRRPDQRPHDCS